MWQSSCFFAALLLSDDNFRANALLPSPFPNKIRIKNEKFSSNFVKAKNQAIQSKLHVRSSREDEIRRKITELKREGRLRPKSDNSKTLEKYGNDDSDIDQQADNSVGKSFASSSTDPSTLDRIRQSRQSLKTRSIADEYADKLSSKLGSKKRLGLTNDKLGNIISNAKISSSSPGINVDTLRKPKLGTLDELDLDQLDDDNDDDFNDQSERSSQVEDVSQVNSTAASDAIDMLRRNIKYVDEDEMEEEDMVDIVAKAMENASLRPKSPGATAAATAESVRSNEKSGSQVTNNSLSEQPKTTSGVGGTWTKPGTSSDDNYQPSKSGTWGAFPRPRNISVAYGGGKRVGADVRTDEQQRQQSINKTKERLRAYREKMGIEVQSEKDNEAVIEEALELAGRAMQRGSYSTGVSCLEKVTQYCSTKSKLGGKVFLELAMAYEAEGKTDQAIALYAALTKSPIEQIKMNADRLLYGLEAMNFMRNEAKLKEFSRKRVSDTFVDATGFKDIAKNFDKVYNTAYIDLDKGGKFYRLLTENVVRSTREARQILLKAVSSGEVERMKVVQALRSISRHFDDALTTEMEQEKAKDVPVDYAGRPIIQSRSTKAAISEDDFTKALGMDGFVLSEPSQTLANLDGEWRLQLTADKKGDGVNFFNSTLLWQVLNTTDMMYKSGSQGFRSISQSGSVSFEDRRRILSRGGAASSSKYSSPTGILTMLFVGGGRASPSTATINAPQQVLLVDSTLLITRAIVNAPSIDNVKDYFSVWRRAERGTYEV